MKKNFLKNLSFFVAINLFVKTIYVFGIDRVVQNTVGTEVYGQYFTLFTFVLIFQIFLDLGIESFTRKEIAASPSLIKKYLSSILVLKLVLGLVFLVMGMAWAYFKKYDPYILKLLLIIMTNQFLASLILYLRANLGGLQKFKIESFVSVFDRLIMIIICGVLLISPSTEPYFKIEWFILSQTVAYFATFIFVSVVLFKETGRIHLNFNLVPYLFIFKKLLPFATLFLLMAIYFRIDTLLLESLLPDGKTQVGIYAHSFRILDYLSNYAILFPIILIPSFAKGISNKQDVSSILRMGVLAMVIPSLIFLISCVPYRFEIFSILYNEHVEISANIFVILIISFMGMCISYTFGALLTAGDKLKQLNIMAGLAVVLSIVLNLILIPQYKALGAAIANASVQAFAIVFQIIACIALFKLRLNYKLIFKTGVLFVVLGAIIYASTKIQLNWILKLAFTTATGMVLVLALKLVNIGNFIALIKSKDLKV